METDTRSSLGQSASETEEDTVSVSKKEVPGGGRELGEYGETGCGCQSGPWGKR